MIWSEAAVFLELELLFFSPNLLMHHIYTARTQSYRITWWAGEQKSLDLSQGRHRFTSSHWQTTEMPLFFWNLLSAPVTMTTCEKCDHYVLKACLECVRTWNQINMNVMQVHRLSFNIWTDHWCDGLFSESGTIDSLTCCLTCFTLVFYSLIISEKQTQRVPLNLFPSNLLKPAKPTGDDLAMQRSLNQHLFICLTTTKRSFIGLYNLQRNTQKHKQERNAITNLIRS